MLKHTNLLLSTLCYLIGIGWYARKELKVRYFNMLQAIGIPVALILIFWIGEKFI